MSKQLGSVNHSQMFHYGTASDARAANEFLEAWNKKDRPRAVDYLKIVFQWIFS